MRADYRCVSSAEGERYVWEQQLAGTPFERHLRSSKVEIELRADGEGTEVTHRRRADPAGAVAARLADDARRPGPDPRRGARRDRAGADRRRRGSPATHCGAERVDHGRDATRSGGGGAIPAIAPELDAEALAMLRERIGELEPRAARSPRSTSSSCRRRAAARGAHRRGRRRERLHLDRGPRSATRPAAATPTSPGCAAGASRRRPTPSSSRPTPRQVRRVLEICAAEGIAVVPFGGGTSVVGGVEPLRGAHERLISLDLGRLREVEVDRRSLTARLGAGLRGPEAEAALGASAASPSATSRSPSSTRRSAASPRPARPGRPRAATGASTRWSARCG